MYSLLIVFILVGRNIDVGIIYGLIFSFYLISFYKFLVFYFKMEIFNLWGYVRSRYILSVLKVAVIFFMMILVWLKLWFYFIGVKKNIIVKEV